MFTFYAQITGTQPTTSSHATLLAALTHLSHEQIRVFAAGETWNQWAV